MSNKSKIKINILDLVIIVVLLLVCLSFVVRRTNVIDYLSKNHEQRSVITISVQGIEKDNFAAFEINDTIYGEKASDYGKIGKIINIKSTPSILTELEEGVSKSKPDFENVDLTIEILADCLVDQNGFFSISGKYITPATAFAADNGKIKFDCVVLSVKKYD